MTDDDPIIRVVELFTFEKDSHSRKTSLTIGAGNDKDDNFLALHERKLREYS